MADQSQRGEVRVIQCEGRDQPMLALKMKGPQAKKYGQPLEAKKGKEMDSPLELLEMQPC